MDDLARFLQLHLGGSAMWPGCQPFWQGPVLLLRQLAEPTRYLATRPVSASAAGVLHPAGQIPGTGG
jgi:hypothetical protein